MNSRKLVIHGDPSEFLHTGALMLLGMWLFFALVYFVFNVVIPKNPAIDEHLIEQGGIALLSLGLIFFMSVGIYFQTIEVNDTYLCYSSNLFPLIKRKLLISEIKTIGFKKDFSRISNTSFSRDLPVVGEYIYDKNNVIMGGINTKVYASTDIELVKGYLKEMNPNIDC